MADIPKNHTLEPEQWARRHQRYLRSMALLKLPKDQVEDMLQETFLAALQSASKFRGDSTEKVWLTAILKNKIADHYRKANTKQGQLWQAAIREADTQPLSILDLSQDAPEWNSTNSSLYERDLQDILSDGMQFLAKQESQVLQMKIRGFSTEAICQSLQITKSQSWVVLCRARKKMKEYLNRKWLNVA